VRGVALALLVGGVASMAGGCGSSETSTPAALRLQREDLAAVSHALERVEGSVGREVASTRQAWPLVVNGLPAGSSAIANAPVAAAAKSAAAITMPELFEGAQAVSLTGPASQIAGLFRTYLALATRGWTLIGAAIGEIEQSGPAGARFTRENVALYIESVYDGHFSLAQIGKALLAGYRKLGGAPAFGSSLTPGEVEMLARAYSEETDRLHPHVGVRLGS
jgi:hypothetical protein